MNPSPRPSPGTPGSARVRPGDSGLAQRLQRELQGEVLFDRFSRGRYSTDASIYQIEPIGVVVPRTTGDVETTSPSPEMQVYRCCPAALALRNAGNRWRSAGRRRQQASERGHLSRHRIAAG